MLKHARTEVRRSCWLLSCRRSRGYHQVVAANRPEERIDARVNISISVYVDLHVTSIIALKKTKQEYVWICLCG